MKIRFRQYSGNIPLQIIGFLANTVKAFALWAVLYGILRHGDYPWELWGGYHIGAIGTFIAWLALTVFDADGDGPEPT